ncbi:Panacea domain-containing protein [Streptococcus gallolyticus]|uniref:Panacea domain-containing protein n=1 Tax=Streptococcus gallolyticus TaxID=315405 RepID=UPI0034A40BF8
MSPALFVANYIIEYSNEKGYEINNLKLQKILYFVNARNIVENGSPLFEEEMEKWKYGPVVPSVYHEYKRFGALTISDNDLVREYIVFDTNSFANLSNLKIVKYEPNNVKNHQLIEETVDALAKFNPFELVDITHSHTLWKKEEKRIKDGVKGIKYTTEEIKEYFENNEEAMIWAH